ncbi:MAG: hypothetical protein JWL90_183, partial [Chthoniobacteraceae bacterium]|nr:hypothetical protein [Chthoniobacteraceae bacterium]
PGTSFFALPGYFLLYHLECWCGLNPDHWWILTLNAWLTTVCSVGVVSALACVMFFRLARDLSNGEMLPAVLATLAFAFGTTFFPFATILFDHALTASLLLGGFYFLRCGESPVSHVLAGLCAGFAAVTNYVAAIAVIFLGFYALLSVGSARRNWRAAFLYTAGVAGPFLLICAYGWVCFGSPFKINNDFQNPLFKDTGGALFGMFPIPRSIGALYRLAYVAVLLVASPFRGVILLAPVLLMGVYGIFIWLREKSHVSEARLCLAIFGFFFVVNMTFNGYHGGFSAGPRYLVPGLPFLALPLVVAFARWRKITAVLGVVSVCIQLLLTATDAQSPVGVGGHARVEGRRDEWSYNLLADYAWPLFAYGRAWPLLEEQMALHMEKEELKIASETTDPAEQQRRADLMRSVLRESISNGEASPFLLGSVTGPVSVNPIGIYEGLFTYVFYPPHSPQCQWASFNVGEFIWPRSRWSLLPLLLITGGLCAAMLFLAARDEKGMEKRKA